jgi:hypothetical protein
MSNLKFLIMKTLEKNNGKKVTKELFVLSINQLQSIRGGDPNGTETKDAGLE